MRYVTYFEQTPSNDKKKEKESTTKGKLDEIFLEIEHFSFNVVTNKEI